MATMVERYCTPAESLAQSLKEMNLMREGKLQPKRDWRTMFDELEKGNLLGDEIPNLKLKLGESAYKVRAINTDTKVGKSDGYRLIYYAIKDDKTIYLLTVYYKKDDSRVLSNEEIKTIVEAYC